MSENERGRSILAAFERGEQVAEAQQTLSGRPYYSCLSPAVAEILLPDQRSPPPKIDDHIRDGQVYSHSPQTLFIVLYTVLVSAGFRPHTPRF